MRTLERSNPFASLVCIVCVTLTAALCQYPGMLIPALLGGAAFYSLLAGRSGKRTHIICVLLVVVSALVNPIFSHNGITVLFVLNDRPVTLEAVCVGLMNGMTLAAVIYYFGALTRIMTSDKLLYVFGKVSPKSALLISGALRFVPLFGAKSRRIEETQTALGLYRKGNMLSSAKNKLKVFSALTSWALENGIITADSMAARGYSDGRRTYFAPYPFRACDAVWIAVYTVSAAVLITFSAIGTYGFTYYPQMVRTGGAYSAAFYALYAIVCFLPAAVELKEAARWKYLISKT